MDSKVKRVIKIVLLVLTSICYLLYVTISMLSTAGLEAGRAIGLFARWNTSEVWSEREPVDGRFSPIGWTFSVWAPIYMFQLLWIVYCWTTVFRRLHDDGDYLCCDPDMAPFGLLVWHFISGGFSIAWILLTDRVAFQGGVRIPQVIALFGITLCLYFALVSSYWSLAQAKEQLCRWSRQRDYWLTVALVQNGLSLYAGWVTVASFINLDVGLIDLTPFGSTVGSSIFCLSLLIVLVVAYAVLDLTVLDPLTRLVVTPHLVVIWACIGSLVQNFAAGSAITVLTFLLMFAVLVALVIKFVLIRIRSRSSPLLPGKTHPDEGQDTGGGCKAEESPDAKAEAEA